MDVSTAVHCTEQSTEHRPTRRTLVADRQLDGNWVAVLDCPRRWATPSGRRTVYCTYCRTAHYWYACVPNGTKGVVMPKQPTKAQLTELLATARADLAEAKSNTKSAHKATKGKRTKRIPLENRMVAPFTCGISVERRNESFNDHTNAKGKKCKAWGVDHIFLRFLGEDDEPHPIGSRLDPEDTQGWELRGEINTYAKANRVGNSRVRFDEVIGAWKGRADMFPPELLKICDYKIRK